MTNKPLDIGSDHCRVVPPGNDSNPELRLEYYRHAFVYEMVSAQLPVSASVLEVGCGAGYGTRLIADRVSRAIGTDLSFQAVAYARQNFPAIEFCQASGTCLPFRDGEFDFVITFQVIEHIQDAAVFVRELCRVLRPGGTLYLTTPNRRLRLFPLQKPWNPYHVKEYLGKELLQLVRASFKCTELLGVMTRPDLMRIEAKRVSQNPLLRLSRSWLVRFGPAKSEAIVQVGLADFFLSPDYDRSLDLFITATKEG